MHLNDCVWNMWLYIVLLFTLIIMSIMCHYATIMPQMSSTLSVHSFADRNHQYLRNNFDFFFRNISNDLRNWNAKSMWAKIYGCIFFACINNWKSMKKLKEKWNIVQILLIPTADWIVQKTNKSLLRVYVLPSQHYVYQCWANTGSAFATLAQH